MVIIPVLVVPVTVHVVVFKVVTSAVERPFVDNATGVYVNAVGKV